LSSELGVAQLALDHDGEKHKVRLTLDESGGFVAGPFPEGDYDLRLEFPDAASVDVGVRALVSGETLDCGVLDLRTSGDLRVLVSGCRDGLGLFLTNQTRTYMARVEGGEALFRGVPEGSYVLAPRGDGVAIQGHDVCVEPGSSRDVQLRLERGVGVHLSATVSRSCELRESWFDSRGRCLWSGPLRSWTPEELAHLRVELLPGTYSLRFDDAEGKNSTNTVVVAEGAGSIGIPLVLP
jgi:hypothetical protein